MPPPKNPNTTTYLYRITNLLNNKDYVGIAINYEKRWGEHIAFSKKTPQKTECVISKSIRKHGLDNFKFEVIGVANTWSIAQDHERFVRFLGMGKYNRTMGGDGMLGWTHSQQTRDKMSARAKAEGRRPPSTPLVKAKIKAGLIEYNKRPGTAERQREIVSLFNSSPEYKKKMSEIQLIVNSRPEVREAKRNGQLARLSRPGEKEKQVARLKQATSTDQFKESVSKGTKLACQRPEVKQNKSNATKDRWLKARQFGFKSLSELSLHEKTHNINENK